MRFSVSDRIHDRADMSTEFRDEAGQRGGLERPVYKPKKGCGRRIKFSN